MRPALQRLLSRPSSLDLLQYLVISPYIRSRPFNPNLRKCSRNITTYRAYKSPTVTTEESSDEIDAQWESYENVHTTKVASTAKSRNPFNALPSLPTAVITWEHDYRLQTAGQLEYESDIGRKLQYYGSRLVDHPEHRRDPALWMNLLDFRRRRLRGQGVKDIWIGMRIRNADIPVTGRYADPLWGAFVKLGLEDFEFLTEKLIPYANSLESREGLRWDSFYVKIMRHFLEHGSHGEIDRLHSELIKQHPPSADQFAGLFVHVLRRKGNVRALKNIYNLQQNRNVYSMAIAELCDQKDFGLAYDMHQFLTHKGDFPNSSTVAQPMIDHFSTYNPPLAIKIKERLVEQEKYDTPAPTPKSRSHLTLSREMMNELHGETFNIKEKKYNDTLGARWFATHWVSLDIAINAIHALGVDAIGPLSLQAIALRDRTAEAVYTRIQQLEKMGISIGESKFSKAIRLFSKQNNQEFLDDLLQGDQHPDALENWKLQEHLLASYSRARDWRNYNRTMAILTLDSKFRRIDEANAYLRTLMSMETFPALIEALEQMRLRRLPVESRTIGYLLERLLYRRRPGKRPSYYGDLDSVVSILVGLLKSGNEVPLSCWEEPLRRLGMSGRMDDVEKLILWLGHFYSPYKSGRNISGPLDKPTFGEPQIRVKVSTYHPEHPLRIIFSPDFQRAIIAWSFMNAFPEESERSRLEANTILGTSTTPHPVTRGIHILHKLQDYGVYIEGPAVRRAIFDRLLVLYGPGVSQRNYNRRAKEVCDLSLDEMVEHLHNAWRGEIFESVDQLKKDIMEKGRKNISKQTNNWVKNPQSFSRSGISVSELERRLRWDSGSGRK